MMDVLYAVTLYVVDGPHDAETYACGPFETEQEAVSASSDLQLHGMTDVLRLYAAPADVEMALT